MSVKEKIQEVLNKMHEKENRLNPLTVESAEVVRDMMKSIVDANRPKVVADAKEKMEGKEICEIFQARIDALKKVNSKDCGEDTFLRAGALMAQDYLEEVKPNLTDYVDYGKMYEIEQRYIQTDWVSYSEVGYLMGGYLQDVSSGIIDEKGRIIGDLKKSKVMEVWHKKETNLPSKALSNDVNMCQNSGAEI